MTPINRYRILQLGQVLGALLLAAGVTACQLRADPSLMSWCFIGGAALYGGCRLAAWFARPPR